MIQVGDGVDITVRCVVEAVNLGTPDEPTALVRFILAIPAQDGPVRAYVRMCDLKKAED